MYICLDVDECRHRDTCGTAKCINTEGSYRCSCEHVRGLYNPARKRCENGKVSILVEVGSQLQVLQVAE